MKRETIMPVFLSLSVLLAIAAVGFGMAVSSASTVNIDCVVSNADEWSGKRAHVEGVVGSTAGDMFVLWNTCLDSSVTVKCLDEPPACEDCRVTVTGDIVIEESPDAERVVILAEEWSYLGS